MCPRMTSTSLIWHIDRGTARCLLNRFLATLYTRRGTHVYGSEDCLRTASGY